MKLSIKKLLVFIVSAFFVFSTHAQDDCYQFGNGKSKFKFFKKSNKSNSIFKDLDGIIKVRGTFYNTLAISTSEKEYLIANGDTTLTSSTPTQSVVGDFSKWWIGFDAALAFETHIGKKSTIEFSAGYERIYKSSMPDTLMYDYPTVDMTQYIHGPEIGTQTIDIFDRTISSNFQAGLQYKYYFRTAYRGFYISPRLTFATGKSNYYDLDNTPRNINYSFTQKNMNVSLTFLFGYQFIIKKHFTFELFAGATFKEGVYFSRKYNDAYANDNGLLFKYPNTSGLNSHYDIAFTSGISIGYKIKPFIKKSKKQKEE